MAIDMDIRWLSEDIILDAEFKADKLISDFSLIAYEMAKKLNFNEKYVVVNKWNIFAALQRYSRDIFGFSRLKYCLEKNGVGDKTVNTIMNEIKDEHKGIGLRIVSEDPYMHKRIAFFVYYFSITKPFSINYNGGLKELDDKHIYNIVHFNSIVLLSCVQRFLLASHGKVNGKECRLYLDYNQKEDDSFLHDLTYRALTRSSIESIIRYMIQIIPEDKYQTNLKKNIDKKKPA